MKTRLNVVIVDDQEQHTELLKTFFSLTAPHLRVQTFNDPLIAKDYFVRNSVDILITDYQMPGLDGLALLRAVPDSVKKILITGYPHEFARVKPDDLDVTVFEKPVPLKALAKVISEQQIRVTA
jgi:YesN/AraC family two-component response regulator